MRDEAGLRGPDPKAGYIWQEKESMCIVHLPEASLFYWTAMLGMPIARYRVHLYWYREVCQIAEKRF